jgi:hypothetical protein
MLVKIGKYNGNRNSGNIYTRVILTEIYHLSGMKSFRDDLIDRMKTGWGRFVLASKQDLYHSQADLIWPDGPFKTQRVLVCSL